VKRWKGRRYRTCVCSTTGRSDHIDRDKSPLINLTSCLILYENKQGSRPTSQVIRRAPGLWLGSDVNPRSNPSPNLGPPIALSDVTSTSPPFHHQLIRALICIDGKFTFLMLFTARCASAPAETLPYPHTPKPLSCFLWSLVNVLQQFPIQRAKSALASRSSSQQLSDGRMKDDCFFPSRCPSAIDH